MIELDGFTALQFKKLKEENLDKYYEDIIKVTRNINQIIKSSYGEGFLIGYEMGKSDECFYVKRKIIVNLIKNTCMSDEEIFDNVALGEEKWREHIKYFREQYKKGKRKGNE